MARTHHGSDSDCSYCHGVYDPRGMCFRCASPEEIAAAHAEDAEREAAWERAHPTN